MDSLEGLTQRQLCFDIDTVLSSQISESVANGGSLREVARLTCLRMPYAGAWLNVVPCPGLGLHLRASEVITAMKLRLGVNVFNQAGPCPACQAPSDQLGDHALCCGTGGERHARHDALRDALHATAVAAALGPSKESRFLLPDSARRPADVLLPYWSGGRDTAWDVTVTHPLQAATVARAATTPGHAASEAYDRKMRLAAEGCRRQGLVFIPLAMESLGGWHEAAVAEVKLGSALARHTGQLEGEAVSHLFQKLSILLVKGNAAMVNNRVPDQLHPSLDGLQ